MEFDTHDTVHANYFILDVSHFFLSNFSLFSIPFIHLAHARSSHLATSRRRPIKGIKGIEKREKLERKDEKQPK